MSEFRMPSLGADMEAGTLVEWLVHPGQAVKRGDVVAVVETQKGAIDVEIFETGTIEEIRVPPGQKVPVGTVLAIVRSDGEAAMPSPARPARIPAPAPARAAAVATPSTGGERVEAQHRARASPAARKHAADLGIDLARITGTGPGGVITLADVEALAAPAKLPAAAPSPQSAMRRAIAAAMTRAKREIPHYYLGTTVNLERALAWLEGENGRRPVPERLLYGVLLVKAVAIALADFPDLNGFWSDGRFEPKSQIHVGVAVSLRQGGLVAPALHDANLKDLDALMRDFRDLVNRTRAGRLRSSELSAPTITVSALGEQGVETVYPIIYPPQVAIVGFGSVLKRPWATEAAVEVQRVVTATLAGDHRVSDGHRGARFLTAVDRLLQEPERL
jgi:pyruvate dehydrogenase E2 component (dihydrolipoamide acetyltransferase)